MHWERPPVHRVFVALTKRQSKSTCSQVSAFAPVVVSKIHSKQVRWIRTMPGEEVNQALRRRCNLPLLAKSLHFLCHSIRIAVLTLKVVVAGGLRSCSTLFGSPLASRLPLNNRPVAPPEHSRMLFWMPWSFQRKLNQGCTCSLFPTCNCVLPQ